MTPATPEATPWLVGKPPTRRLEPARLSERILHLLASQNMCVVATVGTDGPLATPVRYYSRDFELIFTADPKAPKLQNIERDPAVSIGVFAPYAGLASSRGCQIFGSAVIALPGSSAFDDAMASYRWQSDAAERGLPRDAPSSPAVVTVAAQRIVYTEHWLRREGYAPRQFWRAPATDQVDPVADA